MARATLVPFVEFDLEGEKSGVYTGMYIIDMATIKAIIPDVDGDTVIKHRYGADTTLKIPCEEFLLYIGRTQTVDISLLPFVKKYDKGIEKYIINNSQSE